jgi:Na+/H+ antiporter NhaD/arsenite permease-like protein
MPDIHQLTSRPREGGPARAWRFFSKAGLRVLKAGAVFVKRETVLVIALLCALVSVAFVPPDVRYATYMDWKVLSCLFCLMAVVAGLRKTGLFEALAAGITRIGGSMRTIAFILVFVTFFISMGVTNDVALITFIPFSLIILKHTGNMRTKMTVITLQTIAANIGSSLTPVGNPQNLYLFSFYRMNPAEFFSAIAPVVIAGAALLVLSILSIPDTPVSVSGTSNTPVDGRMVPVYMVLFIVSVLSVFHIFDYRPVTALVILAILVTDRTLFRRIDYSLLFTFTAFFVFIGNIQRVPEVSDFLISVVNRNVMLVAAISSQAISNVPAAILLSRFTGDSAALLRGVSIGGMGTIIASLASVISFKFFAHEHPSESLRYLGFFSLWNLGYLALLYGVCAVFPL